MMIAGIACLLRALILVAGGAPPAVLQHPSPLSEPPRTAPETRAADEDRDPRPPPTGAFAEQPPVENPFFDVEDIPAPRDHALEVHGRVDVTYIHFEDDRNVDEFDLDELVPLSPALHLSWAPSEHAELATEIEYDGDEESLEVDTLFFRLTTHQPERWSSHLDIGLQYVPFGIERFHYSPATNPLVDRPSPFRGIFPGSYSDLGVQIAARVGEENDWSSGLELAVTRGLRGPDRDDRAPAGLRPEDRAQVAGRVGFGTPWGLRGGVSGLFAQPERRLGSGLRKMHLVGLDCSWSDERSRIRAEFISGAVERGEPGSRGFRRWGWYVELSHRVPLELPALWAIEAVVRVDEIDPDSRVRDFRDVQRWAYGLNAWFRRDLRLKFEIITSDERGREIDNDGGFIQLEYHW